MEVRGLEPLTSSTRVVLGSLPCRPAFAQVDPDCQRQTPLGEEEVLGDDRSEGPATWPAPRLVPSAGGAVLLGLGDVDQAGPIGVVIGDPRPLQVAVAGGA